jgi:hypothetical protein
MFFWFVSFFVRFYTADAYPCHYRPRQPTDRAARELPSHRPLHLRLQAPDTQCLSHRTPADIGTCPSLGRVLHRHSRFHQNEPGTCVPSPSHPLTISAAHTPWKISDGTAPVPIRPRLHPGDFVGPGATAALTITTCLNEWIEGVLPCSSRTSSLSRVKLVV